MPAIGRMAAGHLRSQMANRGGTPNGWTEDQLVAARQVLAYARHDPLPPVTIVDGDHAAQAHLILPPGVNNANLN